MAESTTATPEAVDDAPNPVAEVRRALDAVIVLVSKLHPRLSTRHATELREAWGRVYATLSPVDTALAQSRADSDEMKDALRQVGIFRSDEAGDDGSEWIVSLEPRGEEPLGSLVEALRRTIEAQDLEAETQARRNFIDAERYRFARQQLMGVDYVDRAFTLYLNGAFGSRPVTVNADGFDAAIDNAIDAERNGSPPVRSGEHA